MDTATQKLDGVAQCAAPYFDAIAPFLAVVAIFVAVLGIYEWFTERNWRE